MNRKQILATGALAGLALLGAVGSHAQMMGGNPMGAGMMGGYGPGYGMGPGMMGGPGPGYGMGQGAMGGAGPGYGMGPGMMGGYGPGHGMGPGMMGGYGPGYGTGPGMMGFGAANYWGLNLSDEQREALSNLHQEIARRHWELMGKMHEQGFRMHRWDAGESNDGAAAQQAFDAMQALQKEMFALSMQARERVAKILTDEQRKQLRERSRPMWGSPPAAR